MPNPHWAERLLARRFGDQRASEIVGDLQEQHGAHCLPLRILGLTASMPWTEWSAVLLFATILALYQWPLTELSCVIPRWFTEHHLTDRDSDLWYFLLTELSYIACFLTALCVLRDCRASQRVWIGVTYSLALPVLSILAMRPYLRPVVLAGSLGAGVLWMVRHRAAYDAICFNAILAASLILDWQALKVQRSLGWAYFKHLMHMHRQPGIHHELMWPEAGLDWIRCILIALFAASALTLTQRKPSTESVAAG